MCTAVFIGETPQPPSPRIWAHIRVPYWSAKIDPLVVSHERDNGKVEKLKSMEGGGRGEEREAEMTNETSMYTVTVLCHVTFTL
jgi:hypothetical protein